MANNVLLNVGVQGQQQVNTLNQSIQQAGQNTTRTVDQFQAMRQELRQMRAVMLSAADGSREYSNALARASEIQRRMREQNDILRLSIRDVGETSKNIAGAMAGVASGFQVAQGTMALFGVENEAVMQTMVKLQAVMSITQGLVQFANGIEDIKDLIKGLGANAAQTAQQAGNLQQGLNNTTAAANNTANSLGGVNNGLGNMSSNMAGTAAANNTLAGSNTTLTNTTNALNSSITSFNTLAGINNSIQTQNTLITDNNTLAHIYANDIISANNALVGVDLTLSAESNALLVQNGILHTSTAAQQQAAQGILRQEITNLNALNAAHTNNIAVLEAEARALQQNAAANNAAGAATASFSRTLLTSLGAMALYMVAIAGIIWLFSKLIEKMNEVPKDLEIKIFLNEESNKKMQSDLQKIRLFAVNYNEAVSNGNKNRIKQLEDIAKKEYGIHKDRLKQIAENVNNWKKAFQEYLTMAKITYYNEALAKKKSEVEVEQEIQVANINYSKKRLKEYSDKGVTDFFMLKPFKDSLQESSEKLAELNAQMVELNRTPFKILKTKSDVIEPEKTSTTTNNKATFGGTNIEVKSTQQIFEDINREVKKGLRERTDITERETLLRNILLAKTETDRLRTQYQLDKYDIQHSKQTAGEKANALLKLQEKFGEDMLKLTTDSINTEFDVAQNMYDAGELSYGQYLKRKRFLLEKYGEDTKAINNEILINDLNNVKAISDSIGILADGFAQSTADEMEIQDNKTNKLKNDLELSQAYRQADSEQQQQMMYELELANYESKKKAFEANKAFQIAGVITQGVSNEMSILAALFDPKTGGPTSPINIAVAAASTIANVATTISSVRKIASTTLDKPVPPSGGSSGGSGLNIALNPAKDTLTSKEENINMMNKSNLDKQNSPTVKVSDINKVQNTVKVREQNSVY